MCLNVLTSHRILLWTLAFLALALAFGQHQELRPLASPNFWACADKSFYNFQPIRFDNESMDRRLTGVGTGQRSRCLVLTKRIVASGDENGTSAFDYLVEIGPNCVYLHVIAQFKYVSIQRQTIDFSIRLWGINYRFCRVYSLDPHRIQGIYVMSIVSAWVLKYWNWLIVGGQLIEVKTKDICSLGLLKSSHCIGAA